MTDSVRCEWESQKLKGHAWANICNFGCPSPFKSLIARDPDLCRTVVELTISNLTIGETLEGDYVIYKIIQTCTLGLLCAPN